MRPTILFAFWFALQILEETMCVQKTPLFPNRDSLPTDLRNHFPHPALSRRETYGLCGENLVHRQDCRPQMPFLKSVVPVAVRAAKVKHWDLILSQ